MTIYSYRWSKMFYLKGVVFLGIIFIAPLDYNFSTCEKYLYCEDNKLVLAVLVTLLCFLIFFLNMVIIDYILKKGIISLDSDKIHLRPVWFFKDTPTYKRTQIYEKKLVKNGKRELVQFFIEGKKLKREIDLSLISDTDRESFIKDFFK